MYIMPIYSLWLTNINSSVYATPFKNTLGTITSWIINFDDLFRKENYNYKKCRLRINMVCNTTSGVSFQSSLSSIGCNLSSQFSGTNTLNTTQINLFALKDSTVTASRITNLFSTNTAESVGININVPTGSGFFTINIGDMLDLSSPLLPANSIDYQIHLMFELLDRIE